MFHERTVLTKGLIRARQAFMQGDQSVWKTIQMLENQLKTLSRREMEGVKIRSRAKWIEEGEKPTCFFFQREKSRIEKNQINLIFDKNNKEVAMAMAREGQGKERASCKGSEGRGRVAVGKKKRAFILPCRGR